MTTLKTINIEVVRAYYKEQLVKAYAEKDQLKYAEFLDKYLSIMSEQNERTQKLISENTKLIEDMFGPIKYRNCLKVV